jgi:hypothetical protein
MYELKKGIFVSEDTREIKEGVYFLKTAQNQKYIESLPKNTKIITPKELKTIWQLDKLKNLFLLLNDNITVLL